MQTGATLADTNRVRARWAYSGFGIGLLVGFAATGVQLRYGGYRILPFPLIFNLIWAPWLGTFLGIGLSRTPRPRRFFRPGTRTLMVAVAYVALLFGVGIPAQLLGQRARLYFQRFDWSSSLAKVFREQGRRSAEDARLRRKNVEVLRAGGIPEGLMPGQPEFLRSLETADPDHRKSRRDLITQSEVERRVRQEYNADLLRRPAEHHERLAIKYEQAQSHPWLPVPPDPPEPK